MYVAIALILWIAMWVVLLRWVKACVKDGSEPPDIEDLVMAFFVTLLIAALWCVTLPIFGAMFGAKFLYEKVFLPWVNK